MMKKRTNMPLMLGAGLLCAAAALMAQPAVAAAPDPGTVFKQIDADKDGTITPAEWAKGGQKADQFANVDTNKDGKIDLAELESAMTRMAQAAPAAPTPPDQGPSEQSH